MNNAEMLRSQEIRYQSEVDQSLQKGHADFMQLLMNSGTQPQIAHAKMLRHQQIIRREEENKIQEDDYEHLTHLMMIQVQQKKRAREHEELHTKQRQEKQRDVGWQHREFRRKLDDAFSRPMNLHRCR
jgi:argininosuccinate lyase